MTHRAVGESRYLSRSLETNKILLSEEKQSVKNKKYLCNHNIILKTVQNIKYEIIEKNNTKP